MPNALSPSLVRMTTALALGAAVIVTVLPPSALYYFGYRYHAGHLAAQGDFTSRRLSELVSRNPELWVFETPRLNDIMSEVGVDGDMESRRLVDADGELVAQIGDEAAALPSPVMRHDQPVYDSGREVAHLEITHSLRGLFEQSAVLALIALVLGIGVFHILRTRPLRAMTKALEQASFLASHDVLTQLPNRMLFDNWLKQRIAESDRGGQAIAIFCVDLDHFKEVNDTLGHASGDLLLQQSVERMQGEMRESDMLARLGGDEFAVIECDAHQPHGASKLAQRLIDVLSEPFDIHGHEVVIGASIGISIYQPGCGADTTEMLQHADTALYSAKRAERGTFRFFEEDMNRGLQERRRLEAALRKAIADGSFHLHYQPQIDLDTGTIVGVEALLRWEHPELGNIAPDRFIPLAESANLIQPLGQWVLETACRQAVAWPGLQMAVNVSPVQFRQDNFVDIVLEALESSGLPADRLQLEITEGILINDTKATLVILNTLRKLGVQIVMDDFGTGYSSLGYLRRFPFSKIKIDRSFINDLGQDGNANSIVDAVIALGSSLGMRANAEGVETREQADQLKAMGCDEVQGYHYGRPMTSEAIGDLLGRRIADFADVAGGGTQLAVITR